YLSGYNKNQTKQIDYENALFTFTEQQLKANKSSHFILIPLSSLNNLYYQCLKKQKGSTKKTIFERHNFSSEFFIKPHQLRHWQNDYLAKKGVPHQVISMLSGRKSAEQTLSYIHITDAQNSSVISDVLYEKETEEQVQGQVGKRIQSKAQYDEATNNLSPTFVS
ncbi:hypothetical protein, partial [Vibrio anguillarum]